MLQEQYFRSIYLDFSSKIETLSRLLKHAGERGRFVEDVIRDILREYLPDKYSLGSGFAIDSQGGMSRQCDIIIYDAVNSVTMFERTGPLIFPVETVYAVLEIKTTFDNQEVKDAFDHIASVKKLVNIANPTYEWQTRNNSEGLDFVHFAPTPPIGIVIGYQSDTRNIKTIKTRFSTALAQENDISLHPDIAVSIAEASLMRYGDTVHTISPAQFMYYPLLAREANGDFLRRDGRCLTLAYDNPDPIPETCFIGEHNGYSHNSRYKICLDEDEKETLPNVLADAPRLLLTTIIVIDVLLKLKRLAPVDFTSYVSAYYGEGMIR